MSYSRRHFCGALSIAGLGAFRIPIVAAADAPAKPADTARAATSAPVPDEFPSQAPALAREMVGVSHGNLERVKELLQLHPTLANAAWDWGFGDWETALGAASHMGNRGNALALLAHGARPSIFSAAMLGQLAVVQAFVAASPGVQGTPGPHGITLLAHARAGEQGAKPVLDYLVSVGGADPVPAAVALPSELAGRYAGTYAFGAGKTERIEITIEAGGVRFQRAGTAARNLVHLGEHAFHPAGAPAVRVRFVMTAGAAVELTVHDPDLVLRARRA